MSQPYPIRSCLSAATTADPTPIYGSNTTSPGADRASTNRSTSSTGNWQGWLVFSTWLDFTFGISQTSEGFLPNGLPGSCPALGPLKCFLLGYLEGIRTESKLKTYSFPLVNQRMTSYRPEKRREQCSP